MQADVSRCKAPHAASDESLVGEDTPKGSSIYRETSCSLMNEVARQRNPMEWAHPVLTTAVVKLSNHKKIILHKSEMMVSQEMDAVMCACSTISSCTAWGLLCQ